MNRPQWTWTLIWLGKERDLAKFTMARKLEYIGHIFRGYLYFDSMLEKIAGKCLEGRRRMYWLR